MKSQNLALGISVEKQHISTAAATEINKQLIQPTTALSFELGITLCIWDLKKSLNGRGVQKVPETADPVQSSVEKGPLEKQGLMLKSFEELQIPFSIFIF